MVALVNGVLKYHNSPLHNLFLTHESRSKPKTLPTLSGHDCSVEWFCEIQQTPQQSSIQSFSNSWEQKHKKQLPGLLGHHSSSECSALHNLFPTHKNRNKHKHTSSICWAWLLCWMVLWNATINTAFLYTVCFLLIRVESNTNTLPALV